MAETKDGGPAFPQGLSLRDYFAGQALAGWLASFPTDAVVRAPKVASFAYEIADAMIAARTAREASGQEGGDV